MTYTGSRKGCRVGCIIKLFNMKELKKLKLNEIKILNRLSKGELKKLSGGSLMNCLACGGSPHKACDKCYA